MTSSQFENDPLAWIGAKEPRGSKESQNIHAGLSVRLTALEERVATLEAERREMVRHLEEHLKSLDAHLAKIEQQGIGSAKDLTHRLWSFITGSS